MATTAATATATPVATDPVTGPARSPVRSCRLGDGPRPAAPLLVTAGRPATWDRAGERRRTGSGLLGAGAAVRSRRGSAEACWLPIKDRLTRHGLRHGHRTLLEELGPPKVLADERLGHEDGSVSARYTHVTDSMRALLMEHLTEVWHTSLDDPLALAPPLAGARPRPAVAGACHPAVTPRFKITPS